MKIKSLTIDTTTINFEKHNLISSQRNSVGKTTLIRLILFSMGYTIPSTKDFDFTKLTTVLRFDCNSKTRQFTRKNNLLDVEENNEYLETLSTNDKQAIYSYLYDDVDSQIRDNLLGSFYFDQEKGWTLLNRGKVIGSIPYSIEEILEGINNEKLDDYTSQITDIEHQIKFYRQLQKIAETSEQTDDHADSFDWSTTEQLENALRTSKMRSDQLQNQISRLEKSKKSNEKMLRMIENFQLTVKIPNHKPVRVTRDNIEGFSFNQSVIDARISTIKEQLAQELIQQRQLINKYKSIELMHIDSQIDKFRDELLRLQITSESIKNVTVELSKKRARLRKLKKQAIENSNVMQVLYEKIKSNCDFLGVGKYIDTTPDFILTSNLKRYSGAVLHLIVFGFRMAVLSLIQEKYNLSLPIILDSPSAGELDEDNLIKLLQLLDTSFKNNQIFMATINTSEISNIDWDYKIEMKNSLTETLELIDNE